MDYSWVIAATAIGWLLTTLGWLVTNRQANDREARKEFRAAVTSLEACVTRLLDAYRTYLTEMAATKNEQARLQVYSDMNRLRRLVEGIGHDAGAALNERFTGLFESITGGDFESKTRKFDQADNDYGRAVAEAEGLLECAEAGFRRKYIKTGGIRLA